MIPIDKLEPIVNGLLARSKRDQVKWYSFHALLDNGSADGYEVQIKGSKVFVGYRPFANAPDEYMIQIRNPGNRALAEWVAEEGDALYVELKALFNEAARYVTGWDRTLSDIEAAIESEDEIGESPARPDGYDALPF